MQGPVLHCPHSLVLRAVGCTSCSVASRKQCCDGSRLPGSPWEQWCISTWGRSWFMKQNCLQDPRHTCYGIGTLPAPLPQLWWEKGTRFPVLHWSRKSHSVLRAGTCSVFLLFFCSDCQDFVLSPEAFHKEVDDGTVEVLPEGGAVEVMAFIWVDLWGKRGEVTCPAPLPVRLGQVPSRPEFNPKNEFLRPSQCNVRVFSLWRLCWAQCPLSEPIDWVTKCFVQLTLHSLHLLWNLQHEYMLRAQVPRVSRRSGQKSPLSL